MKMKTKTTTKKAMADDGTNDAMMQTNASAAGALLQAFSHHIEHVSVKHLTPYSANARTHSKKQIRQIADSITEFGFTNPILVDAQNQIIAGHGRLAAAKVLAMEAVPVIRLAHLSPAQKRAYLLADNRLAEKAGWDKELLAAEFKALIDLDFDIDLTGFNLGDVDLVLDQVHDANRDPTRPGDDVPEVSGDQPVSRKGDLWQVGAHRLICGDAREMRHADVIVRHWQSYTGEAAILVATGQSFEEVASERQSEQRQGDLGEGERANGDKPELRAPLISPGPFEATQSEEAH